MTTRWLNNLRHHQATVRGFTDVTRRNDHTLTDAPVIWLNKANATLHMKTSSDLQGATLQHFNDFAFFAIARINAHDTHRHTIAMHHLTHLRGG